MYFDSSEIISITEANKNFSSATRIADRNGRAIIFITTDQSIFLSISMYSL